MNEWETCIAEWSIRCRELQLERDALKLEVYDQKKLAEKYWKEAREADNKRVASAAALRDERDRLADLVRQAQPHVCSLLCPSVKAMHDLWTHTKLCLNMQAALAPTKGVQQHPAFDEYGEHRQPTGLGDL